jgi:hypothetical protein
VRRSSITFLTAALAALALAIVIVPASARDSGRTLAREACGQYNSTSLYAKGKVVALRGVGCRKALNVAKHFDHTGDLTIGHWRCAYAHSDLPNLFSCGWPAHGNLRQAAHALLARGVPGT